MGLFNLKMESKYESTILPTGEVETYTLITVVGSENDHSYKLKVAEQIAKESNEQTFYTTNLTDIEKGIYPEKSTIIVDDLSKLAVKSTRSANIMRKVFKGLWRGIWDNYYTVVLIHNTNKKKEYAGSALIGYESTSIINTDTYLCTHKAREGNFLVYPNTNQIHPRRY